MAREVFKIVNNIAPTFIENLITLKRSQHSLRNDKSAVIPRPNNTTKYGLNPVANEGTRNSNSLPNVFRVNENYPEFSRLTQNWSGLTCKCIQPGLYFERKSTPYTQTILSTCVSSTNADLRRSDRADGKYKHSYNTPTFTMNCARLLKLC